jgi:CheY-like chemotaxis protein
MINKILCIDDDPITLMLCKKVILKSDFSNNIDTAKNGKEALDYFDNLINENNTSIPEIIFLDLNMPIMDGWDFLDAFMQNRYSEFYKKSKVIILSSSVDPKDIDKSKEYPNVIKFLAKPITKDILNNLQTIN